MLITHLRSQALGDLLLFYFAVIDHEGEHSLDADHGLDPCQKAAHVLAFSLHSRTLG